MNRNTVVGIIEIIYQRVLKHSALQMAVSPYMIRFSKKKQKIIFQNLISGRPETGGHTNIVKYVFLSSFCEHCVSLFLMSLLCDEILACLTVILISVHNFQY